MPGATTVTLVPARCGAHLDQVRAPEAAPPARTDRPGPNERLHAVDPETAKTLVSAALVASIALFSLVSFQALLAQVLADLRAARRAPKAVPVPVRAERREPPRA